MGSVHKIRIVIAGFIDESNMFCPQSPKTFDIPVKDAREYEDIEENLMVYLLMGKRILR